MKRSLLHKGLLAPAILLLIGATPCFGQGYSTEDVVLVQGVIDGIGEAGDAAQARALIASLPDVKMIRVCPDTHNAYIKAIPGHHLTMATVNEALAAGGFRIRCFQQVQHSADFTPLNPANCSGSSSEVQQATE